MRIWLTKIQEKIAEKVVSFLIVLLLTGILLIWNRGDLIRRVDGLVWFWFFVISFVGNIFLAAYIIRKHPKYVFLRELGLYQEKRTGTYFCTSCMANNKQSCLKETEMGWFCMVKDCKQKYYKPGKEPKPAPARVRHEGIKRNWIRDW